jgi:hypothetical protein
VRHYGEEPTNEIDGYPSELEVYRAFGLAYDRHPNINSWAIFIEHTNENPSSWWGCEYGGCFAWFGSREDMFGLLRDYPLLHASVVTTERERLQFQEIAVQIRAILMDAELKTVSMYEALDYINEFLATVEQQIRWWGPIGEFINCKYEFAKELRMDYMKMCHEEEGWPLLKRIPNELFEDYLRFLSGLNDFYY